MVRMQRYCVLNEIWYQDAEIFYGKEDLVPLHAAMFYSKGDLVP
jgi:hypothetical protein